MADDPLRLQVLKALSSALSEITVANGYKTDIGKDRVFRGRVIFGETDPIPMLSILEVPIPVNQLSSHNDNTSSAGQWELMIQGFVDDDHQHPTDPGHIVMADVKKRLAMEKKRDRGFKILGFDNFVTDMQIGAGVVRPPDEVSAKAYFWLSVNLDICENWEHPYADDPANQ